MGCDLPILLVVADNGGGVAVAIGMGATICCCGGTRIPARMAFLFGSGLFFEQSIPAMRGAIETGFFFAGFAEESEPAEVVGFLEISTSGATLAVLRSTLFGWEAAGVDCIGLLMVAIWAVRTSIMSHGMAVMLLGCV